MKRKIVNHYFKNNKKLYFPTWEVDKLFLGTFNPVNDKQKIDYYYRRPKNKFWNYILSSIPNNKINKNDIEFDVFSVLKENKFGCIDIIDFIEFPENFSDKIVNEFDDKDLFRVKHFKRNFNYEKIKKFILEKNVKIIFTTWGIGPDNKEFKILNEQFKSFCDLYSIELINLPSPSPQNRNKHKVGEVENQWNEILKDYLN